MLPFLIGAIVASTGAVVGTGIASAVIGKENADKTIEDQENNSLGSAYLSLSSTAAEIPNSIPAG